MMEYFGISQFSLRQIVAKVMRVKRSKLNLFAYIQGHILAKNSWSLWNMSLTILQVKRNCWDGRARPSLAHPGQNCKKKNTHLTLVLMFRSFMRKNSSRWVCGEKGFKTFPVLGGVSSLQKALYCLFTNLKPGTPTLYSFLALANLSNLFITQ